jgi:hypothetical protein
MKVELQCGDTIAIPDGCKAVIKDDVVVFEKEQEFKDGDILAHLNYLNYRCPFIYKGTDKNGFHKYYIGLDVLNCITLPNCTDARWGNGTLRHATEDEKQALFDKMKAQGLRWNAEEKKVEKIRWRADVGVKYYFVDSLLDVLYIKECWSSLCNKHYSARNYFRTEEQAEEAAKRVKETLRNYHEEITE